MRFFLQVKGRCQVQALLHDSRLTRNAATLEARHRPTLYDCDLPSSVIRFRTLHARSASASRPPGARALRPLPMIDLYRKKGGDRIFVIKMSFGAGKMEISGQDWRWGDAARLIRSRPVALLHGSRLTRNRATLEARHGPMQYDCDLPSSIIRFRTLHARRASASRPPGARALRPPPMIDLYRKKAFSARAC